MSIFPKAIEDALLANGRINNDIRERLGDETKDFEPVVKLVLPGTAMAWLVTEIDPDEPSRAHGLCDLGFGTPETGDFSLEEITSVPGPLRKTVQIDQSFTAKGPLSAYQDAARKARRIVQI